MIRPTTALLLTLAAASAHAPPSAGLEEPAVASEDAMQARCEKEVLELHRFFQDWFNGVLEPTDEDFARFRDVMAEGFVIVTPGGSLREREALVSRLRSAHGSWRRDGQPAGRLWIENVRFHRREGALALVTYEEWQETGDGTRGRLSTALFRPREDAPNGVEWLHVHETWLPDLGSR